MIQPNLEESTPPVLPVHTDSIPSELRPLTQFGVWRYEQAIDEATGEASWDKIPRNARTGSRASSTNPRTWSSLEAALQAYERGGYSGIAFFLRNGGGLVGIDMDRCVDAATGEIAPRQRSIIDRLGSYTEYSPSGRGIRAFAWGELPQRDRIDREGQFECYQDRRFLTLTGHRVPGTPATIEHRQAELLAIHSEVFAARIAKRKAAAAKPDGPSRPCSLSDLKIIERASRMGGSAGQKFRTLWAGSIAGYRSHSEADLALCGYLAFFTGPDATRIDELFRGSGLFRGKWKDRPDYRDPDDCDRARRAQRILPAEAGLGPRVDSAQAKTTVYLSAI